MSWTGDWTDWAGDHPEQAEAELRAEREKAEEKVAALNRKERLNLGLALAGIIPSSIAPEPDCEHEFHVGVCLLCEAVDENYEPTDAQIPGTYETRKAAA